MPSMATTHRDYEWAKRTATDCTRRRIGCSVLVIDAVANAVSVQIAGVDVSSIRRLPAELQKTPAHPKMRGLTSRERGRRGR